MNLRDVFPAFPRDVWEIFEDAAKADWLRVNDPSLAASCFSINYTGLSPAAVEMLGAVAAGRYSVVNSNAIAWVYAVTRLMAAGPKVFRPTAEQCSSLEHVAISIPMADYRQPYPAMLVELPAEYRADVDRRTGGVPKCPRYVIVHHWPVDSVLMTGCQITDKAGLPAELVYLFGDKAKDGVIEDVMGIYLNSDKAESALLEAITRVALNLMLLLAHTSSRLVPTDPAGLAKCREKLKKGIRPDLQRREIAHHVHAVVPDREVIVRDTRNAPAGIGTHGSPACHWRRGHWRAAPGFGAAKGKGEVVPLVFVRPCLVYGAGGEPAAPVYVTQ